MARKISVLGLVLLLAGVALAAREGKSVKLTGYIIDNMCSGRAATENGADKVKNHTVKCAQMPNCAKSGYALFSDNKLYKLDEGGNTKTAEILKNTKLEKGLQVEIEGTLDGETLTVKSIKEVATS
ncbi:MAG: hypothetical protein AABO57_17175 [Acidobacteriota bacterium]